LSVCPLKGDIYIRLSKDKFVKLFREGDVFDLQDLEKYTIKKGVEYLFIRKEQCQEFAQKYLVELQKNLSNENLTVEEVGKLNHSVHETVHELSSKLGFTKEVQELTKTQVQLTVKSMGKDPDLAEILKKLEASEGQYISSHSTLCAYLACSLASQMQWGSETTFYKLSLASFLHDITLENHELAEIQTLEELEQQKAKFTEKEMKDFKNHPAAAAEMAKRMTEVPPDVDTIIRQHHEKPDGSGFPRKLSHAYIAPLSCVFIVSHDLTQYTLKAGEQFNMEEFLKGVRDKYKSSQFKKVLGSLEVLNKIKSLSAAMQKNKKPS
jgi:HD-GYP domain-containing protein (c-di-GMP phosphodiesterase class II)